MAALTQGTVAPEVSLSNTSGKKVSLKEELKKGPVLLAFFKISCPVCQFTFPMLERVYKAHHGKANIIGVSQNPKKDTESFLREYGITFPVLLDDTAKYPVSNAYGLTNVPTLFFITPDGEIEISSVGWSKSDVDEINRRFAESGRAKPSAIFKPGEDVPDFKAG